MKRTLGLVLIVGCARASADEPWAAVAREDLVLEIDVTGSLRATRSVSLGTPAISDMRDFKIVKLAPEGTEVKKGQVALAFDTSELDRGLTEREGDVDEAAQEIVKRKIDLDLSQREGEMRLAEAEATLRKAKLKADLPAQYTAAVEMKLARIDLEMAETEHESAKRRLGYQVKLAEAEIHYLRDRQARYQSRLDRLSDAINQMKVPSPVDGLVVYPQGWRGEKKKVGDSCWQGEGCLEVVDVSQMTAKGEVDETESARLRVGQPVSFRLESMPEIQWRATVARVHPTIYRQSPRTPLKVAGVDLQVETTDRTRMRPGMMFRGRIETDRVKAALLVPIEAVFLRPEGPVVFRRTKVGFERVAVRLGRRNARMLEVLGGLEERDLVSRRDLEQGEERR